MRIAVAISFAVHVVMLLWLILGPGARALSSASTEPVMVDLVSPKDVPKEAAEETKSKQSPDQSKVDQAKPEPPKPDSSDPANPLSEAAKKEIEDRVAAVRMARLLGHPVGPEVSAGAPPSDTKSSLTGEEIARFKTQIRRCWGVPTGLASKPGINVLIRMVLTPDGRLSDTLLAGGNGAFDADGQLTSAGNALTTWAGQALQRCQPYAGLPADKYEDWQIVDMTFTARGPSGMAGETDQSLR